MRKYLRYGMSAFKQFHTGKYEILECGLNEDLFLTPRRAQCTARAVAEAGAIAAAGAARAALAKAEPTPAPR